MQVSEPEIAGISARPVWSHQSITIQKENGEQLITIGGNLQSAKTYKDALVLMKGCSPGYYFKNETNECTQCEPGYFSEDPAASECKYRTVYKLILFEMVYLL